MSVFVTPVGQGVPANVPGGSTNGTALGTKPNDCVGVRFYLPAGASVTYTIAPLATPPSSAPSPTIAISDTANGAYFDENLANGMQIYVTATAGSPVFRFI